MKKTKLIWLAALVGAFAFGFVGCKNESNGASNSSSSSVEQTGIALDKTELTLTQYDTAVLTLEGVNENASITWASSDTAVATVDNGVVYALNEGSAVITASVAEGTYSCAVVVEASEYSPVFTLDKTEIVMQSGDEMTITPSVTLGGKMVKAAYTATLSDSEKVTAVIENGIVTITGVTACKDVTVTVNASYFGKDFEQVVTVTVTEEVAVNIDANSINLYTYDANGALNSEGYYQTQTLNATVYKDGVKVQNAEVDFTVEQQTVATVTSAGVVSAVGEGQTLLTASYTSSSGEIYSAKCTVTVSVPYIVRDTYSELYLVSADGDNVIDIERKYNALLDGLSVKFADVTDETPVDLTAQKVENGYQFDRAALQAGERKMKAYAEGKIAYEFPVHVYSKVIKTAEEFVNMQSYGVVTETSTYTDSQPIYKFDGYFILGANIDVSGKTFQTAFTKNVDDVATNGQNAYGFVGILDGRGYTVTGGTFGEGGLFGQVGSEGVIRNIAFIGGSIGNTYSIMGHTFYGSLENVLLDFGFNNNIAGWGISMWLLNAKLTNVVIQMPASARLYQYTYAQYIPYRDARYGNMDPTTFTNCYSFSDRSTSGGNAMATWDTYGICSQMFGVEYNNVGAIQSYATTTKCSELAFEGFDATVWDFTGDKVTFRSFTALAQQKLNDTDLSGVPSVLPSQQTIALDTLPTGATFSVSTEKITVDGTTLSVAEGETEPFSFEITINYYNASRTLEVDVIFPTVLTLSETQEYVLYTGRTNTTPTANTQAFTMDLSVTLGSNAFGADGRWSLQRNGVSADVSSMISVNGKTVTFAPVSIAGGEYTLAYVSDSLLVEIPVLLVSKVITSADDLLNMKIYGKLTDENRTLANKAQWKLDGYFVLGANIDLTGNTVSNPFTDNIDDVPTNKQDEYGFVGTFDGQNYTITGGTFGDGGLFGSVGSAAVVKNVAFTGITISASGMTFGKVVYGTVENVLLDLDFATNTGFGFANWIIGATFTNVVVHAPTTDNLYCQFTYAQYIPDANVSYGNLPATTFTNCYSFCNNQSAQTKGSNAYTSWETKGVCSAMFGVEFNNVEDIRLNSADTSVSTLTFTGFDSSVWDFTGDKATFKTKS